MALLERDPFLTSVQDPTLTQAPLDQSELPKEIPIPEIEADLEARFSPERIGALSEAYLVAEFGDDWREKVGDRKSVVGIIPATSEFADVPRMVETTKFSEQFKRPMSRVYTEYTEYDEPSTFIVAIDVTGDTPTPAGAMRIIEPNETAGMKSINDLVDDTPKNPWIDEIKENYFGSDEQYSPLAAWERLGARVGIELDPAVSFDVATVSVLDAYKTDGSLDGTSLALYHTCLRYALGNGIENLVSIQDLRPLEILQKFGNCFSVFDDDIKPHEYGGPYLTIPAWAELQEGMRRVRSSGWGNIFIEGEGLDGDYYLLKEYSPEQYSDEAVQLGDYLPAEVPPVEAAS